MQVERVELIRREKVGSDPHRHTCLGSRSRVTDAFPEPLQTRFGLVPPARVQTCREEDCVDGACTGTAHSIESDGLLLQESVENTPGERAKGAAALQSQREKPLFHLRLRAHPTRPSHGGWFELRARRNFFGRQCHVSHLCTAPSWSSALNHQHGCRVPAWKNLAINCR